jgi:hypothetical protein
VSPPDDDDLPPTAREEGPRRRGLARSRPSRRVRVWITIEPDVRKGRRAAEDELYEALTRRHYELRDALARQVFERLPDAYLDEVRITRGSITIGLIIAGVVAYGGFRQGVDYIVHDVRWVVQQVVPGQPFRVTASGAEPEPGGAEIGGAGLDADRRLMNALVISHFILLIAVLAGTGVLLATVV